MRPVHYFGGLVPLALALDLLGASATAVLAVSALGMIPAAAMMSDATEHLAAHSGPGVAGLLNVSFGNAPELIIALFALADGLQEVVKASLVGSVIGNAMLVLGLAMLAGGWRRERQLFDRRAARAQSTMLAVGVFALLVPTLVRLAQGGSLPAVDATRVQYANDLELLSLVVALVTIATYAAGVTRSMRAHREAFEPAVEPQAGAMRRPVATLAASAALVAVASDVLVGSIEDASSQLGVSQFFIGAIVVAVVGNAAEHYVAIVAAVRDDMDLAVSIAVGSAAQVGLLLAPLVVLISFLIGPFPMALVLNGYELVALALAAGLGAALTFAGVATRRRGALLVAVYAGLAVAFLLA